MNTAPEEHNGATPLPGSLTPPTIPGQGQTSEVEQQAERIAPVCCCFRLSGKEYFLAIEYMLEIADLTEITLVPLAPPHLRGLVNIRGEAIPVIDLARLHGDAPSHARDQRLIISDAGGEKLAFLAEGIPSLSREREGEEVDVVHFVRSYKIGVN